MNLGVVSTSLEAKGGAEIYLLECLRRWQDAADITLYTTGFDADLFEEHGVDLGRIRYVKLERLDEEKRRFDLLEDLVVLPRLWEQQLRAHDVYFLNGFPLHFTRCHPAVFMCHEPLRMLYDLRYQHTDINRQGQIHIYPEQKYREVAVKELEVQLELIESMDRGARFDHLIANSRAISRYVSNIYNREADTIAYPGVNLPATVSEPPTGSRALYVGRLWSHKRVDLLVRAVARLDVGFLDIVGQGPEREPLQDLAKELGVADRVVFHGVLSNAELAARYESATCGAYMSVREPFGMMPLEAAAAGRPIIASPDGGYSEILDRDAAFFVPPRPAAIARVMRRVFENPSLARRMGARARELVSDMTWEKTAGVIFDVLERAASRNARRFHRHAAPVVGAHYYPWYDAGRPMRHWGENTEFATVSDLPVRGAYTSAAEETINRHLDMAEDAGIDFFSINWEVQDNGVHPRDLEATEGLFAAAEARGSRVALTLMLTIHTSLSAPIVQTLERARALSQRGPWLRLRARPVLWFFVSADFFGSYYALKAEFETRCKAFVVVATGSISAPEYLPADVREFVNGWCLFVPFRVGPAAEWDRRWQEAYRHHTMDVSDPIRVFTVCPGYDDMHLNSAHRARIMPRLVGREDGAVYRQMLACARRLDPGPEIVMITSFNEFHENTQVEPTRAHGDKYLELTREFTRGLAGATHVKDSA